MFIKEKLAVAAVSNEATMQAFDFAFVGEHRHFADGARVVFFSKKDSCVFLVELIHN